MSKKKQHGVFYTQRSPFDRQPFRAWLDSIPSVSARRFVEPFAGENAIPQMLSHLPNVWICQDINVAKHNRRPDLVVRKADTFKSYPKSFRTDVAITNPPYLSRNEAGRQGVRYPDAPENDLYKIALRRVLDHHDYAAMIIPAAFLTAGLHEDRIVSIDLLQGQYFDDTHHPTCLAMFAPAAPRSWTVWKEGHLIGDIQRLRALRDDLIGTRTKGIRFNDVNGQISLMALDKPRKGLIQFGPASRVQDEDIKVSSRAYTKIFVPGLTDPDALIVAANRVLNTFREQTADVFLTPYRGLRVDGDFRRRLNFKQASAILGTALASLNQ